MFCRQWLPVTGNIFSTTRSNSLDHLIQFMQSQLSVLDQLPFPAVAVVFHEKFLVHCFCVFVPMTLPAALLPCVAHVRVAAAAALCALDCRCRVAAQIDRPQ